VILTVIHVQQVIHCTNIDKVGVTVQGCGSPVGCGDSLFNAEDLLTTSLSAITTLSEFQEVFTSEFIDAKNRKTITHYPTLRLLYDRYMNTCGNETSNCSTDSARFDYLKMSDFSNLVGNYWVDLIEQVIPSTTIWGATYKYGNTIFDSPKFRYKESTMFFCDDPNATCQIYPMDVIASATTVDVRTTTLPDAGVTTFDTSRCDVIQERIDVVKGEQDELRALLSAATNTIEVDNINAALDTGTIELSKLELELLECRADNQDTATSPCIDSSGFTQDCSGVYILQTNRGSEFIGSVKIIGNNNHPDYSSCAESSAFILVDENDPNTTP
jgi:hypothetical protein